MQRHPTPSAQAILDLSDWRSLLLSYLSANMLLTPQRTRLKTRRGTYVVFLGFILATLASLLFFSGRYREMRILVEQGDNQCKIWCFSKNAVITEEMEETLAQNWMKRHQGK